MPGLGLGAGSHSDTVNEGKAPCLPALALQKTESREEAMPTKPASGN